MPLVIVLIHIRIFLDCSPFQFYFIYQTPEASPYTPLILNHRLVMYSLHHVVEVANLN